MLSSLRQRVTLKPPVRTYDEEGEWTTAYPSSEWVEVWAAVQPMSGRERAMYRQVESDVTTKIILRSGAGGGVAGLGRTWLVAFNGTDYEIESMVEPSFRHKLVTLLCKERS